MSTAMDNILLPSAIDLYVDALEPSKIENLGTRIWLVAHHRLQKLHQQAIIEARDVKEEAVKETIISHGKMPVIVYEAVCVSVWKEKILPEMMKLEPEPVTTIIPYMVELMRQREELAFNIAMRCITVLGYIAQNLDSMPVSVASHVFTVHDVPVLLASLIEHKPWSRPDSAGNKLTYIDGKWQHIEGEAAHKVTHTEGQLWIAIRQLLLDPRCPAHYDINDTRKNQLIKLQCYLHDTLLDQLPPLLELKYWLAQLAVTNAPVSARRPFVLEVTTQMRSSLMSRSRKQWKELSRQHAQCMLRCSQQDIRNVAQGLSETYDMDTLEMLEKPPACVTCGDQGVKRCSRCKTAWYCGRECQVKNWPKHKKICDLVESKSQGDK
uniref:(California timema) hypothetical protein n=1 Tax=Timema californicum TaxID=61474 RepID=A0A7R9JCP8_TIMCA|nr:unnamed protein product [Timema californicum]